MKAHKDVQASDDVRHGFESQTFHKKLHQWWNGIHGGLKSYYHYDVWVRVPPDVQICGYGGMVDPLVLEASVRKDVSVRVRLPVQKFKI